MENKRGSHVGVVLSFIIFILFLVFMYSILSPSVKIEKSKQNLLDYLKIELIENLSTDLTTVTIIINESYNPDETCLEISHNNSKNLNLVVKDKNDVSIEFDSSENKLKINWTNEDRFFKVHYSTEQFNEFFQTFDSCAEPNKTNGEYSVGSIKTNKYVFVSKIIQLIEDYKTDYESVKGILKIPTESDFDFSFAYEDETIIGITEKTMAKNIYAEEIPIQYVDTKGNINYGFFNIRLW